jgi:hypothetical protein
MNRRSMEGKMTIVIALVGAFALVMLLLVMREVVLWYLKINRLVETLESIDLSLSLLPGVRAERVKINQIPKRAA